jgi:type II secretory pathway component GspD/PulD (secretin)
MSVSIARTLNVILLIVFMSAVALSAVAQGQTPTSPQQSPSSTERRVRPAPSSGILWDPNNSTQGGSGSSLDSDRTGKTDGTGKTGRAGSSKDPANQEDSSSRRIDRKSKDKESTPATAKADTPAEKAASDSGPGREPPTARGEGGGPRTVGGKAGDKTPGTAPGTAPPGGVPGAPGTGATAAKGAAFTKGEVGAVTLTGEGAFEPVMKREPEYGEIPDAGEKITLEGPVGLQEFLTAINLATNWNVVVSPALQDVELRFWVCDVTPKQALEVLKFNKVYYEFDEETKFLRVMTREEYLEREFGKTKPHEFKINHADVAYIESLINSLLSPAGRAISDQRTNNIYVWDTEDNIKEMTRIVEEMDVPLQKAEYTIQYAEVADIEAALATLMSPSGSVLPDVRTGQIFVWDSPSILEKMNDTVARLDQPVESKTFYITHVNAEDVVESLESMLTERGTIQVDPRYNTLVVTDLPPRIEKITAIVETLDKALETRSWVLKYADVDFVADQIEAYIPGEMGQIVVQDEIHQVTVTGLPSRLDEINTLIEKWDVKRRQVLIEAHIVEVNTDVERAFNVNWSTFANVDGSPFAVHSGTGFESIADASGSGQIASAGRLPYAVPRYGALQLDESGGIIRPLLKDIKGNAIIDRYVGGNLALTLDYLDKQQKATILSSPRVTVQDSEEAIFENATKVPYVSSQGGYGGGYGGGYYGGSTGTDSSDYYRRSMAGSSRVEFIDVGTILSVLPRITDDDNILLDISAEDSTFTDKKIVVDDLSRTVPEKTVRRADTQVRVNSGNTIVLGGLRRDRAGHSTTRTPILGDLPLIGKLFQNPKRSSENASLLIFITTTIVDESTMPESAQISHADEEVAKANRQMNKNLMGRIQGNKNEISVSIGQTGILYCTGEIVTVDQLREQFFDVSQKKTVTAVIRKHPQAPIEVVNDVTEAAMEAGLRIEFDSELPPIVPAITPTP